MTPTPSGDPVRERHAADLGELAGSLVHEFANLLNNLTLHVALWEQTASAEQRDDLKALRLQIQPITGLMDQFQRLRRSIPGARAHCLVPAAVERATREDEALASAAAAGRLRQDLAGDLPPVAMHADDAVRVCRWLATNALRAGPATTVLIRALRQATGVALVVEDDGPDLPAGQAALLFDPQQTLRPGTASLELAAARALVRRAGGKLDAQPRPGGGVILVATLPVAVN